MNSTLSKRRFLSGTAVLGATLAAPTLLRAQPVTLRWGDSLAATHPQVMMAERIAKSVKEKSGGRIDIQVFPNGQLGTGKDMVEAVSSGALQLTTEGAGAVGAFLPQLSLIEAPYLWRDAAHMAKSAGTPIFAKMNDDLVAKRGMRMMAITYYGRRHLTTGKKEVRTPADMVGFKLRVPPVDTFLAMAEAWGARATPIAFSELYIALSQGAVDGQENPLPTIQSGKFNEVQKYLVLTSHIITPRMVIANDAFIKAMRPADRDILLAELAIGAAWQDKELQAQEASAVGLLKGQGMTVIEPDLALWRKPVLEAVPKKFESKWGKGAFETFLAL